MILQCKGHYGRRRKENYYSLRGSLVVVAVELDLKVEGEGKRHSWVMVKWKTGGRFERLGMNEIDQTVLSARHLS